MPAKWFYELTHGEGPDGSPLIRMGIRDESRATEIELAACSTAESLDGEIARLGNELENLARKAVEAWGEALNEAAGAPQLDGAEVWKRMEGFASDAEMIGFFNSLTESNRKAIAEYVLTQVSMFKGRGPVFSEHYDSETHLLQ